MPSQALRLIMTLLVLISGFRIASAQQFRVYTRVERLDDRGAERKPNVIARSLTLFHAGKVYDLITGVGEVIVFEPAHERFVVFTPTYQLMTTVSFDEINRLLDSARDQTSSYAERLKGRSDPESQSDADSLLFQLAPKFQESFDPTTQRLQLSNPKFSYSVECRTPEVPETLTAYLNYADWAARLNFVLHPTALYPAPRLKLNQVLRSKGQIPSKVELRVAFATPLQLQADHHFDWFLSPEDRQEINYWETLLKGDRLKEVSFREYQQLAVMRSAQAKR